MSIFSAKEVRRSIRDFESATNDVINSSYVTYKTRIRSLNNFMHNNNVIKHIVAPFLEMEVDPNEINGGWDKEFNLPPEIDYQLAYLLKMFEGVSKGNYSLEDITFDIYKNKNIFYNIQRWIEDVCIPGLRELGYRLNDLIEDEVEGKEEVESSSLRIINYGSITASDGGNIAMGENITQTISYENIVNEIMEKVKRDNIVDEDDFENVENIANELQNEINKSQPSQTRLKQIADKAKDIGEAGLLKTFSTVVMDPRWGQAVSDVLLNIT